MYIGFLDSSKSQNYTSNASASVSMSCTEELHEEIQAHEHEVQTEL